MSAKRTYRSVFVAYKINGWPIIMGGVAFFVRWESHEQFAIFENWIRHRWSVIFEPEKESFVNKTSADCPPMHLLLGQIFLFGVDHANTAARRTHFVESVKCRFAYVDQKCAILRWNFVVVLAQRHQVENVAGLRVSRGARIRVHWSGQRMTYQSRLVEYHQLALFVVLCISAKMIHQMTQDEFQHDLVNRNLHMASISLDSPYSMSNRKWESHSNYIFRWCLCGIRRQSYWNKLVRLYKWVPYLRPNLSMSNCKFDVSFHIL